MGHDGTPLQVPPVLGPRPSPQEQLSGEYDHHRRDEEPEHSIRCHARAPQVSGSTLHRHRVSGG